MTALSLPPITSLPFFSYGSFKPGELAFTQIESCLDQPPIPAIAPGTLKVRDGLPLFHYSKQGGIVPGFVLIFRQEDCLIAYERICQFEPQQLYYWEKGALLSPPITAYFLIGKKPLKGRPHDLEENQWSFRLDPVFQHGLLVIRETVEALGKEPFHSSPPEKYDWSRFFKLQMSYLLLWSAVERFCSFAYGPGLRPEEKIVSLGKDPRFITCVEKRFPNQRWEVSDSRDPGNRLLLDKMRPSEAAQYLYQVRSNLSHRGKSAYADGEIVRESLIFLLEVFVEMLSLTELSIPVHL